MKDRRSHPKIDDLPDELRKAVHERIVAGDTYRDISDWIRQKGHSISKTAVGDYGRNFLARLEQLKLVKEQARSIIDETQGQPATEMAEAANQIGLQLVMETLLKVNSLEGVKITEVLKALARLEQASTSRERLKFQYHKGATAAAEQIKARLRKELDGHPDLIERMTVMIDKTSQELTGD